MFVGSAGGWNIWNVGWQRELPVRAGRLCPGTVHCCLCSPSVPSCTGILPAALGLLPATLGTRCGTALGLLWSKGDPQYPLLLPQNQVGVGAGGAEKPNVGRCAEGTPIAASP